MECSLKLLILLVSGIFLSGSPIFVSAEELAPAPALTSNGKFHVRLLERPAALKNRHSRSDLLDGGGGVRKLVNSQPRLLEVLDFQVDDDDIFDQNSKRFDDYGHSRFGKRNEFDDYGHSRFGRRK